MNINNNKNTKNNKNILFGGSKNIILIFIIILSVILFFIILFTMIKTIKQDTPNTAIFSNINLTEPVDKFLHNLSVTTKIDDKLQIDKIITGLKNDKLTPIFFSLSENYYLQIPKSQI